MTHTREGMVREQIERRGICSPEILRAFLAVPREQFVPRDAEAAAYEDHPVEIGWGQTISQPFMVATMMQVLAPAPGAKILEVGTGSGYQTALLCELGCRVFSIERIPALAESAARRLATLGYHPAIRTGDGTTGWIEEAPFDAILVAAGSPTLPAPLVTQLAEGGRLVIPVGEVDEQELVLVERRLGRSTRQTVCSCRFVKLIGEHGWANPDPRRNATST